MTEVVTTCGGVAVGQYGDVDDDTARLPIELQIQDITQQEDELDPESTDAHLALQRQADNLRQAQAFLTDRRMARSIATAVTEDGALVAANVQQEELARRDRELALRLQGRATSSRPPPAVAPPASGDNDEIVSRLAGLFVSESSARTLMENDLLEQESRQGQQDTNGPQHSCVICSEAKRYFECLRVPCGHEYCHECLQEFFIQSYRDESLFPPRCCRQTIPIDL